MRKLHKQKITFAKEPHVLGPEELFELNFTPEALTSHGIHHKSDIN